MCVLILAFIFFGSNKVFHSPQADQSIAASASPVFISSEEVSNSEPSDEEISRCLSEKFGHAMTISRVERVKDDSGKIRGYLAWEK